MKLFGLTRADHTSDGTKIKGFDEPYQDRVRALVEVMCVKKKSMYASNELLENMYQAVKKRDHNWAPLILSSLRRMLIRVHTSPTREIKGAELIDALLKNWFPDEEHYIDPEPDQESEEVDDGSELPPDVTPVRPEGEVPPDVISGGGSRGNRERRVTRGKKDQMEGVERQSSSSSGQARRTRKKKRKAQSSPSTLKDQGQQWKRLRRTGTKPRYKDTSSESMDPREAEEVEEGAITSKARSTPSKKGKGKGQKAGRRAPGETPVEASRVLLTLRASQSAGGTSTPTPAVKGQPGDQDIQSDPPGQEHVMEETHQGDTLFPRNLGTAFSSAEVGTTEITAGMNKLVDQMKVWMKEVERLRELQTQQDLRRPTYQELVLHNQELASQVTQQTEKLQAAATELTELKTTWADTKKKLIAFTEDQAKERAKWAENGGELEARRRQRIEMELKMNARLQDYDRLALENQQLQRQLEVVGTSTSPANRGLARHLLATTKKQVWDELKAYSEDQEWTNRYLVRFSEAFPAFTYWSDDEQVVQEEVQAKELGGGVSTLVSTLEG